MADSPKSALGGTDYLTFLQTLSANGYSPVPIVPADKTFWSQGVEKQGGKTPGRLVGLGWQAMTGWHRYEDAPASPATLRRWAEWPARGVGTPGFGLTTGTGGLGGCDLDTLSPTAAEAAQRLAEKHLGRSPVRTGKAPKTLRLYRCEERLPRLRSAVYEFDGVANGLEWLGSGQQMVGFGVHPETMRPYEWAGGSPLDIPVWDLVVVTRAQIEAFFAAWENEMALVHEAELRGAGGAAAERVEKPEADLTADALKVRAALPYVQNEDRHYEDWIKIAHALKSALRGAEGEALDIWHEFSAKSDKYDPEETDRAWSSINAEEIKSIGAGTWFGEAQKGGMPDRPDPGDEFDPVESGSGGGDGESSGSERLHWLDEFNRGYAFVLTGGGHHILWETTDDKGRFKLEHLHEGSFHKLHAARTVVPDGGKKPQALTQLWMSSHRRRTYTGLCFRPGGDAPAGMYNLWRGFAVEPAECDRDAAERGCALFLQHLRENCCRGDRALFDWVVNWMAHIVQYPEEKPGVALVLRGGKGVGKTVVASVLGRLLGSHYLLTANRRFLTSNFNGHMESLLLMTLDEAFWSGDKAAEGVLKDLITGDTHLIEHKGKESYAVDNLMRVIIIGNEEWLVPASADERRFAVLDVGDGRKQDVDFFARLWGQIDSGGAAALLRYLQSVKVSRESVKKAPATEALADQIEESLDVALQWWSDSLAEEELLGVPGDEWPESVSVDQAYRGFEHYCSRRNIRGRLPSVKSFGRELKKACPSMNRRRVRDGNERVYVYELPPLATAVAEWKRYTGRAT